MNILLLVDPDIPVPPLLYGGIERIAYMLSMAYRRLGHQVTVMAGPNSNVPCVLEVFGKNGHGKSSIARLKEIFEVWKFLCFHRGRFDLIHNFGRLIYLMPILNDSVKKIMTYQRIITRRNIFVINCFPNKNLIFTAISDSCAKTGNVRGRWFTVYNGVPLEKYRFQHDVKDDAPLLFLGRLDQIKGAHTAIRIAKMTSNKLILAGNKSSLPHESEYFNKEIEPWIDGKQIIYVGPLSDEQKSHYLGMSKALLFPIEWEEPFGIVMIEALACGTPVIGFNRGAVPEVVKDGITGFICNSLDEMVAAVSKLHQINRSSCRAVCEERFSSHVIADHYLSLIQELS